MVVCVWEQKTVFTQTDFLVVGASGNNHVFIYGIGGPFTHQETLQRGVDGNEFGYSVSMLHNSVNHHPRRLCYEIVSSRAQSK